MNDGSEAARYSATAIEASRPVDPDADPEEWAARQRTLHRLIFRAGAYARLEHQYGKAGDDSFARLAWLADHGVFADDIRALAAEVEDQREKAAGFTGTYGLTESEIHSMVGEGFHTAFRKAADSPEAVVIHKLIRDMDPDDWGGHHQLRDRPDHQLAARGRGQGEGDGIMSDKVCIACDQPKGEPHLDWCPVVTGTLASLPQDEPACSHPDPPTMDAGR